MIFFLFGPLPPYMDVIYYRRIFFSSTGRQAAAGDLELHDRFCDEATWKNDPGRTNNFLEKTKVFRKLFFKHGLSSNFHLSKFVYVHPL